MVRGVALGDDDRLVRTAIERVLCDGAADFARVAADAGVPADAFADAFGRLRALETDGLVAIHDWTLRCTGLGRRYLRNVAACFDPALHSMQGRHSRAI